MATVESSGVAKAGLATGITGLSLAGLWALGAGGNNGGLFSGGLFGGGNQGTAMAAQGAYQAALSEKDSVIGQLRAEKYSDCNILEAYKQSVLDNKELRSELYAFIKPLSDEAANNRVNIARMEEQIKCLKGMTEMEFVNIKKEFGQAIALESERRINGDNNLMCYVNATFVPGKLVMPKDKICPEVMQRYNSWVAPTDTAPATQPITGSVSVGRTA